MGNHPAHSQRKKLYYDVVFDTLYDERLPHNFNNPGCDLRREFERRGNGSRNILEFQATPAAVKLMQDKYAIRLEKDLDGDITAFDYIVDAALADRKSFTPKVIRSIIKQNLTEPGFFWFVFLRACFNKDITPIEGCVKVEGRLESYGFSRKKSAYRPRLGEFIEFLEAVAKLLDYEEVPSSSFGLNEMVSDYFKAIWKGVEIPLVVLTYPLRYLHEVHILAKGAKRNNKEIHDLLKGHRKVIQRTIYPFKTDNKAQGCAYLEKVLILRGYQDSEVSSDHTKRQLFAKPLLAEYG